MYIPKRPETRQDPHGTRQDNYAWLEDRDSQDVLNFLKSQNEHTRNAMRIIGRDTRTIQSEIMQRLNRNDISVPVFEEGFYYYQRSEVDRDYLIHCRRKTLESPEEILIDENVQAAPHEYYAFGGFAVSPDGKTMAYAEDITGGRLYTIYFMDLVTRQIIFTIENTHGGVVWAADGQSVFYLVPEPQTLRTYQVKRQYLVANSQPVTIFEEQNPAFSVGIGRTSDKQRLIVVSHATDTSIVWGASLTERAVRLELLAGNYDIPVHHQVDRLNGYYYDLTEDHGKNGRLVRFVNPGADPEELIPHREDVVLDGMVCFTGMLAWEETVNAQTRICFASWDSLLNQGLKATQVIKLPHEVCSIGLSGNTVITSHKIRFTYETPIHPPRTYELNTRTGALQHIKTTKIPRYDERDYVYQRVWVPSRDGTTKIPMTLAHHRTVQQNGSAPALIYGYGAYGISLDSAFSVMSISLMDRGFVIATAHIRGGGELGHAWYDSGRKLQKWNTFWDFIDCSEYLITQKYCSKHKLTAMGGSAGGLLMGVILNERPDLYQGIVAQVPFVDALSTMLNDRLPLTTLEYTEWGNPSERECYDYIRSYSPYDNVKAQAIPHVLVISGYNDSQVPYWEPAKWVAKLREHRTNANQILLMMTLNGGHQSQSGLTNSVAEVAVQYSFLLAAVRSSPMTKIHS